MVKNVSRLLLFLVLVAGALPSFSQVFHLNGWIRDHESGTPIENVTVYINGTTLGTITDISGHFDLDGISLPCDLILSHVSYQIQSMTIQDSSKLKDRNLTLKKRFIYLEEATVFSTPLRSIYMEDFRLWFLGKNYKDQKATILNDSVLVFTKYDSTQFSVDATGSILVHLPLAGYILKVDLVHFKLLYKEELEGYHCSILGYYYFEAIHPDSRRKQRNMARARANNFYNSSMHFCRSLYHNQLAQNGYLLKSSCPPKKESAYSNDYRYNIKAEYISNEYGNTYMMLTHSSCKDFVITYHENARKRPVDLTYLDPERSTFYYSQLSFLADTVHILKSGRIPENTMVFSNSIGEKGVAYMLPEDYIPSMQ